MLRVEGLGQGYDSGGRTLTVLKDINFTLEAGGFLAITGPSGSGKTTLLGLLAGLDRPSTGRVLLDGTDLGALDEDARAELRRRKVGFIFQSFQLIPTLTARENVQVPLELGLCLDMRIMSGTVDQNEACTVDRTGIMPAVFRIDHTIVVTPHNQRGQIDAVQSPAQFWIV